MLKKLNTIATSIAMLATSVSLASAHVTVSPDKVGVGVRQDFSVGVPVEKDIPTTSVRLVIPDGLEGVTPYVKPGWEIDMEKTGEGEETKVTEITWSGGSIPTGLRDAFVFRAQVPAKETTLTWKAYQTYEDGTVVSWDQEAESESHDDEESEDKGPYSQTKVLDDLTETEKKEADTPLLASGFAVLVSLIAIGVVLRNKKKS